MYSEADLDQAVAAGVLPAAIATDFRNHVAALRMTPAVDEEHFRLITGFNDIFVSIAIVLLLVAVGQIGAQVGGWLSAALIAATAWGLAEYFTARRRMALPSILLLLAFSGGVAAALFTALGPTVEGSGDRAQSLLAAGVAAVTAAATWLHWQRFRVPITVAAGAAALVGLVIALIGAIVPDQKGLAWLLLLVGGIGVFGYAMWWDMSDRERRTRRSDVAFWLHLVAAPMIAHPTFQLLGVFSNDIGIGTAATVMVLYVLFAVVALSVDRRALLVSSLSYVLYAMYALIRTTGAVELSAAFTALVIGSALLSLSAFWQPIRARLVARLGAWQGRLPPVQSMAVR